MSEKHTSMSAASRAKVEKMLETGVWPNLTALTLASWFGCDVLAKACAFWPKLHVMDLPVLASTAHSSLLIGILAKLQQIEQLKIPASTTAVGGKKFSVAPAAAPHSRISCKRLSELRLPACDNTLLNTFSGNLLNPRNRPLSW